MKKNIIIVRGGGDIATGTIYKLHQSGYPVLVTEIANPSAIRRQVAFSEAVYEKSYTVEGVTCYFAENLTRAYELLKQRKGALMIDPDGAVIREVKPAAVVDGILAKKNLVGDGLVVKGFQHTEFRGDRIGLIACRMEKRLEITQKLSVDLFKP